MPKKIQIIETVEYVYYPRIGDTDYYEAGVETIEDAAKFDEQELKEEKVTPLELADDFNVVGRVVRIIEEP